MDMSRHTFTQTREELGFGGAVYGIVDTLKRREKEYKHWGKRNVLGKQWAGSIRGLGRASQFPLLPIYIREQAISESSVAARKILSYAM